MAAERKPTNPETPVARMVSRRDAVSRKEALAAVATAVALGAGLVAWTLNEAKGPAAAVKDELREHVRVHEGEARNFQQEMRDARNDFRLYMRLQDRKLPPELTAPLPELEWPDGGR